MYQGRRVDGRTNGRRWSDAHMHPSAMFLPSPVKADRRARPSMHIFVFQELALAHNHNASGCTGASISVDDMASELGDGDEMGELL